MASKKAAGKAVARTRPFREALVGRSDGVAYTDDQVRAGKPDISAALGEDDEYVRAWQIKLGKAIKYNLGSKVDDSP